MFLPPLMQTLCPEREALPLVGESLLLCGEILGCVGGTKHYPGTLVCNTEHGRMPTDIKPQAEGNA